MDLDKIKRHLKTSLFGKNIYFFDELDSTNSYAMKLAREGAPEGTIVLTDFQKAGKGRLDRQWYAKKGENLLVSLLLRPELEVDAVQKITLATATILIASIRQFLKNRHYKISGLEVKWPNDLLLHGKKLGGILAESKLHDKKIEALVLGIGMNINTPVSAMPAEIRNHATSLIEIVDKPLSVESFLSLFLKHFEERYEKYERTNYAGVVKEWKKYCQQIGKPILIHAPDAEERGHFHDVDSNGYLIYRDKEGKLHRLITGEIEKIA
jgi:BirA family transcriptional regulator, biotin operon repressor / biotin---[acetyl-CoA-carboxylase] ligase